MLESEEENELLLEICTPPEISSLAASANQDLLPRKSRDRYDIAFNSFIYWQKENKTNHISENILLGYFKHLSSQYSPPTLWSQFSMLKKTLKINRNIDIQSYGKVIAFIKNLNVGYRRKKAKIFESRDIDRFLNEAPDNDYLAIKVACIFGIMGASRRSELVNLKVTDIQLHGSLMIVNIKDTKNNKPRSYVVSECYVHVIQKYQKLRPSFTSTDRFFLNYKRGRCTNQVIGINTIGSFPKRIAEFLRLPNPELYTGHSFRRSAATILADAGADRRTIKDLGGWESDKVVEGYIENSFHNRKKIADLLTKNSTIPPDPKQIKNVGIPVDNERQNENNVSAEGVLLDENNIVLEDLVNEEFEIVSSQHSHNNDEANQVTFSRPGKNYRIQFNNCTNCNIKACGAELIL